MAGRGLTPSAVLALTGCIAASGEGLPYLACPFCGVASFGLFSFGEPFLRHPVLFAGNSRHSEDWHTKRPPGSLATSKGNASALGDHTLLNTSSPCHKILNIT